MKYPKFISIILLALSSVTHAQDRNRELIEQRIEVAFTKMSIQSQNSPFVENLIRTAKSTNPNITNEVWDSIKPELADAANSVFLSDGGLSGGAALRTGLAALSNSELDHLAVLLEDPVLARFQSVMSTPAVQRATMEATAKKMLLLRAALNAVLVKHSLKEVH